MTAVKEKAPDFSLQSDSGDDYLLSDHAGKSVLLVFYPGT